MSSVLRRYLSLELLQYWLVITLVLWLILVAARFSLYLGQAASGQLPAAVVLWLLGLKSVAFFVFLLPLEGKKQGMCLRRWIWECRSLLKKNIIFLCGVHCGCMSIFVFCKLFHGDVGLPSPWKYGHTDGH